jgi:mono/diheme cytochrome c family protein
MSKAKEKKSAAARKKGFSDQELQEAHGSERKAVEGLFLPFFLFLLVSTWFTWAAIGLSADANNFALHPDRDMTPEELKAMEARAQAKKAERLYSNNCVACHQPNGRGIPGQFPPLDGSQWVDNGKRIVSLTMAGMEGPVEVLGQTYNNKMGAVAKLNQLKPEDIAIIVNYVRSSWSNAEKEYPEISVDEVKAVQAEIGDRSIPWSSQELLEKYPLGGVDQ